MIFTLPALISFYGILRMTEAQNGDLFDENQIQRLDR